ncbi:EAL and HDOD domain-containing protein [Cytobacillus gottheilii]|uniref:EAL and HDOD domain-containing protein n=1 Tax=Cytobacillus gottheilii TaxID=859144 RepID=UPI0009BC3826|nr:HDOD domain-containing protein [Cytobacillus gottheilii]
MEFFVARQPILTRDEEVFAYELLYRGDQLNVEVDGDQATADVVVNGFLNIGIEKLSAGKPCFVNFTEKLLEQRLPLFFNRNELVVEILESVQPSKQLIDTCLELKQLGYRIALDDFVLDERNKYSLQLLRIVDILKIDILNTSEDDRLKSELVAKKLNISLLAEKVETREAFEDAKSRGYNYFQGYFFSKPVTISTHDVPSSLHSYYEIIQSISKEDPSIDEVADLFERDISLSYKLLKLINSPAYRPKNRINSIRQAIMLLGLIELEKWVYIMLVREMSFKPEEISNEIIHLSLVRAKMCEEIRLQTKGSFSSSSYFITGMFSLIESLVHIPMTVILNDLPLDEVICDALNGKDNHLKKVLDLAEAVESANWGILDQFSVDLNINEHNLFNIYSDAIEWSESLLTVHDPISS